MANRLQDAYRNNILGDGTFTNVQLDADTIAGFFVDTADDTVIAADQDVADITAGALVPAFASIPALGTKTIGVVAVGVFDSADLTFTALSGDVAEHFELCKDTDTNTTSILIAHYDTFDSGMPVTPNGGDVIVQPNASGWFQV